jgi:CBS domain-containing protein
MTAKVETAKSTESLKSALKRIVTRNIGSIVVVEENEPVGIVTERDISRCVVRGTNALKRQVKNVMSSPLITVETTKSVQDAMALMLKHGVRRLPVVKQRRLVGIVSERDVLRWVLRVSYEPHIPPEVKEILEHPVQSKN